MKFRKSFRLSRGLQLEVRKRSEWIFPKVRLDTAPQGAPPRPAPMQKPVEAKQVDVPETAVERRRRRKSRVRLNAPPPPWSSRKRTLVAVAVIIAMLFITLPRLLNWADQPRAEG